MPVRGLGVAVVHVAGVGVGLVHVVGLGVAAIPVVFSSDPDTLFSPRGC